MVAEGHSNKEIADRLGMSESGVKMLMQRLFDRYGVRNRASLIATIGRVRIPGPNNRA